jgi:glycosyltransferase involved in cell wall biosynthesis
MKKDLNIAGLTDHHIDSGIGYYSYELTKALTTSSSAKLYKPYRADHADAHFHDSHDWIEPVHYRSFRGYRPYVLPFYLRAGLVAGNHDLVHAHWYLSGLAATYANKRPTIITMHDVSVLHTTTTNDKFLNYYRWALNRFKDRRIPIITVSEQARLHTIEYAEYPEELVHAVHNGLNPDRFFPTGKAKAGAFTIVYSGGLSKHKNLELLLQAMALVQVLHPDVHIKIAGGSPQNTAYPELAAKLRLKNVEFVGFVPDQDMNDFYNSGDLMVYTSKYEGFGMAPLEAMSCGLPVITTPGGALNEVSGGGAVVSSYEADELSVHILDMIEDPLHRDEVAAKGLTWVKQYTWEDTAEKTLKVYNTIL